MNFLDLFSGIGGFRQGLENNGHKAVGYVEIDKFARRSYEAMYGTQNEWKRTDIKNITDEEFSELKGSVDIITGGFPCVAFSTAGKRLGFKDKTSGTLFFDVIRAIDNIQPKIVLLENVKGLVNHDKGKTLQVMIGALEELGYVVDYQLFNSKFFNVPQNRERVYIVATKNYNKDWYLKDIVANHQSVDKSIEDILENTNNFKRLDNPKIRGIITNLATYPKQKLPHIHKLGNIYNSGGQNGNIYSVKGVSPTVASGSTTTKGNGGVGSSNAPKVLLNTEKGMYARKLTPLECWRLQGFNKESFEKAKEVTSDTQLYKQAGNSVTVNVIEEIGKYFT